MTKITYGDFEIDTSTLPEASVNALLRKGLAHFMGNEQASKVTAWKNSEAGKDATEEQIASKKAEFQAAGVAALADGTVGNRVVGVTVSPIEKIMRSLAKSEIVGILKATNMAIPKGEGTVTFNEGSDSEQKLTMEDLIERRLEGHGDRLKKEAEAEVKRRDREAKKLAEAAQAAGGVASLL